jgi:pyruvate/2-oxoglutarate dehydrogenase complex dihydrolipoamide dehydrogenase (E3) component
VEFLDQILGPEDSDIAELVAERLAAEGIEFHTSTKALRARGDLQKVTLTVASTGEEQPDEFELEGDALLVATGRRPNIEGLGLENTGVEFTPRGIPSDLRLRTNVKHIYACGDVNGLLPFTHIAGYEGGIALTNIVLHLPRKADYSKTPWCTYLDPEVASVGLNEKRAQAQGVEYQLLEESFADNDRAVAEGERLGKIKILISPKGKVLGCQIVGANAGELIHEWVAVMAGGVSLSSIAGAIHAYPTLSEISKRAAGGHFSKKLFNDRTRSWLRLLFHLKGRACSPEKGAGK